MLEITVLQLLSNTLSTSSELSSPNLMPKKKKMLPMIGEQRLIISRLISRASLVAQMVKNLPAMWETWV